MGIFLTHSVRVTLSGISLYVTARPRWTLAPRDKTSTSILELAEVHWHDKVAELSLNDVTPSNAQLAMAILPANVSQVFRRP
jgi:hypothetical protein